MLLVWPKLVKIQTVRPLNPPSILAIPVCISALECVSQRFTFVLAHFAMVISRYRYDLLVREFY